jgi:transposase
MSNFRQVDRETGFLLPPSVDERLPERHLARFVVEVIDQLDLSAMVKAYRGSGSASYHPSVLLGLLVYGYATGVFSSRKLERASYDSVAFRFIAANDHPDHDTIAAFRRRFLGEIETLFVGVLLVAREMGLLQLGTVALDGGGAGRPVGAARTGAARGALGPSCRGQGQDRGAGARALHARAGRA